MVPLRSSMRWAGSWGFVTVVAAATAVFAYRAIVGIQDSPRQDLTTRACGLDYRASASENGGPITCR